MAAAAAAAATPDHLFNLRNNFYLGAYQAAINNSDLPNLSPDDAVERDSLVYRSYIALGSYQVHPQSLSLVYILSLTELGYVLILLCVAISACDQ